MASDLAFVSYVCEQISSGSVTFRKMFGEYMVYVNSKPLLLVCDDTVFVKKHEALSELLKDAETAQPYSGAKEHYILNPDDRELLNEVIMILEPLTAVPVPRRKQAK